MNALTRSVSVSLLLAAPVAAQTYEPVLVTPQIAGSPTTATPLNLGDDNTAQVDLGFEFTYWGQTFTSAWVSSNGFISFESPNHLCCNGFSLEQAQRNTIYAFWTDLISGGNPYYTRGQGSILFGWYNTQEYATQNRYTFEIGLANDNTIQFNYGAMPSLIYHQATAGITGPNPEDNLQTFYGSNTQFLQNQSGVLRWNAPQPVVSVDCTITPMDPSCPPEMIQPIDYVSNTPIVTIVDAATADAAADAAEIAAQSAPEPEQEIETVQEEVVTESITEQVAEAIAAETTTTATAVAAAETASVERLSPEQVAALAANGPSQDAQTASAQDMPVFSVIAGPTAQFASGGLSGGLTVSGGFTGGFSGGQSIEIGPNSNSSSPSSVANTLEVLNMSGGAMPSSSMAQGSDQQGGSTGNPDAEKMEAMASVPGFSAYAQVALQDRPDFYAIRDIYRNRRLRDANFEMYRITQSNNAKWQEMVNAQYQR